MCEQLAQGCYTVVPRWEGNPRPNDCESNASSLTRYATTCACVFNSGLLPTIDKSDVSCHVYVLRSNSYDRQVRHVMSCVYVLRYNTYDRQIRRVMSCVCMYSGLIPTVDKADVLSHRCLMISRGDGSCRSFTDADQVCFVGSSVCLEPVYDNLWRLLLSPVLHQKPIQCFFVKPNCHWNIRVTGSQVQMAVCSIVSDGWELEFHLVDILSLERRWQHI